MLIQQESLSFLPFTIKLEAVESGHDFGPYLRSGDGVIWGISVCLLVAR
jgi:hypothetical protein